MAPEPLIDVAAGMPAHCRTARVMTTSLEKERRVFTRLLTSRR